MDPMESIKATFFQECDELLSDMEQSLLALEAGEGDSDTINAVFRAVHSVNGGAGAFVVVADRADFLQVGIALAGAVHRQHVKAAGEQRFKADSLKAAGIGLVRINLAALPRREEIRALVCGRPAAPGA